MLPRQLCIACRSLKPWHNIRVMTLLEVVTNYKDGLESRLRLPLYGIRYNRPAEMVHAHTAVDT